MYCCKLLKLPQFISQDEDKERTPGYSTSINFNLYIISFCFNFNNNRLYLYDNTIIFILIQLNFNANSIQLLFQLYFQKLCNVFNSFQKYIHFWLFFQNISFLYYKTVFNVGYLVNNVCCIHNHNFTTSNIHIKVYFIYIIKNNCFVQQWINKVVFKFFPSTNVTANKCALPNQGFRSWIKMTI